MIAIRPRRNRRTPALRSLVRETELTPGHLVLPLFIHAGADDQPIDAMPGCHRWSVESLVDEVGRAADLGIGAVVLFPAVDDALKDPHGEESWNPDGLVQRAVKACKTAHPDVAVMTDVALDPYSSHGHDGIMAPDGRILNDESVEVLCRQALSHARAGADVVAPSDMMDGRVGAIRSALDGDGHTEVGILSYTAKYASAFYGPFRGALDSAPKHGDKTTYQMDPANAREAERELALDLAEGADVVMVKPAGPYLDVIHRVAAVSPVPVAAYQVSGEYLMVKAAAASGWLDERAVATETLVGIRRAGADFVLSYFAADVARWLS